MKLNYGSKIILTLLSITFMFYSIYQIATVFTYKPIDSNDRPFISEIVSNILPVADNSAGVNQTPKSASQQAGATFTSNELAQYDGQNGHPAYIAMDGSVYDVSLLGSWRNGQHHGVAAGTDLTGVFDQSPHVKSILKLGQWVGTLVEASAVNQTVPSQMVTPLAQADSVTSATKQGTAPLTQNLVVSATNQKQATWTSEALLQYNGMSGKPAYIAVNGIIYDATSFGSWQSGSHHGIKAGQDVTAAFANSPHAASLLNQLPVIGQMGKQVQPNVGTLVASATGFSNSVGGGDDDSDSDGDDDGDDDGGSDSDSGSDD